MNYCAIDFETATRYRNSACSVAVVEVEDGIIRDTYYTLIKPPYNEYLAENILIHGIRPEDTASAPTFAEIWPELATHLEGRIVVAHNSTFDMGVLRSCLKSFGCKPVSFKECCTVNMSRKAWPALQNHKLNTVADYMKIKFNHHDALEDSRTCAIIPLKAAEELGVSSIQELADRLGVSIKPFNISK